MNESFKRLLRPLIRPVKSALEPLLYSRRPPLCENVVIWALEAGYRVKRIHEPFSLDLPIPIGCETDRRAAAVFDAHSHMGLPAQFLICLPGGGVPGCAGFTTMPTGEFLVESVCRPQYLLDSKIYRSRLPLKKRWLEGDCYSLISFFDGNYGHWFGEELPRLFAALPHLPRFTHFLVPASLKAYQRDSLSLLGITPEQLVPQNANLYTKCEHLWFATPLGNQDWAVSAPDIVQEMSRSLIRGLTKSSNEGPERIYVSREGLVQNRRLINENDLLRTIQGLGFQVVKPECLSLADQIRTFKDAKVVLGAFGAGLTNMLFSRAPSMILELQDPIFAPRYWYWKMASILGHEWRCYVGQPKGERPLNWANWPSTPFSVDKAGLVAFVEDALAGTGQKSNLQWWNRNHPSVSIRSYCRNDSAKTQDRH